MPPPPIPVRTEGGSNPPPIPAPAEKTDLSMEKGHGASSSSPAQDTNLQEAPDQNAKRRPTGAVATVMVSGHQGLPSAGLRRLREEAAIETTDEHSHANNPYDLQAAPGSTVSASYPFQGDETLQQLSFVVSAWDKVTNCGAMVMRFNNERRATLRVLVLLLRSLIFCYEIVLLVIAQLLPNLTLKHKVEVTLRPLTEGTKLPNFHN